ncbi:MAG: IclR family transcriptional regulator [Chloroflexi bacterium]|nr:IclR family transcriptional regulator [Chloroflexota bacterium]
MSRVQSIERAFAVLGALADGPVGVTDVAARVGLPKSTAARMLASLEREGAVEQVPGETRYRLGPRIVALASGLHERRGLVAIAHPMIAELAAELGEAAGLSVPDGRTVHYVDQVDSPNPVQVRDWTGSRIPMHAVSSGLVFLAHLGASALARFLAEPMERFTPRTVTDGGELLERLRDVRREGHAWVHEEFAVGIASVAAPIADADGQVVAAIHVHGPTYRFPAPGSEDAVAVAVRRAAAQVGTRLRGSSR